MRKMLMAFALTLVLSHTGSFAQYVDGHWFGVGIVQTTREYNNYMSELILRQKGKTVWGWLNYYFMDSLVKVDVSGDFDERTHRLRIKPFSMIYFLSPSARNSIDCNMSGDFMLTAAKTGSILSGTLVGDAAHKHTTPDIVYRLAKSNDTLAAVQQPEVEISRQTVAAPADQPAPQASDFAQRKKLFTKELEVVNNSLRIELYDNGEIDYDSVSLFLNDKRILAKTMLTHHAIRLTIQLDPDREYNELAMFAENLGMIPPNTAALIVYDGTTRYETLLSSDLSNNATLRIRKKK